MQQTAVTDKWLGVRLKVMLIICVIILTVIDSFLAICNIWLWGFLIIFLEIGSIFFGLYAASSHRPKATMSFIVVQGLITTFVFFDIISVIEYWVHYINDRHCPNYYDVPWGYIYTTTAPCIQFDQNGLLIIAFTCVVFIEPIAFIFTLVVAVKHIRYQEDVVARLASRTVATPRV